MVRQLKQKPILEKLLTSSQITAKIVELNIDANLKIADKFSVQSIPTLIIFKDGNEIERFTGIQPENILKSKLQ
jgi:thioredoxin 1